MVMETPGPQEVGREFVRQYYTMLHGAPLHLHRFYSNNSAFVHGGIEDAGSEQPPVIGQEAIHKKIVSLNFNDCHAKIRQVDAQATIEDSVVVQVTGELSNNGEPMRRFMQTFVLVPQTPKKFYVHNDIFRYQDEVFHDDGDIEEASHTSFITDHREEEMENGSIQEPVSTSGDVATSYYDHVPVSIDATDEEESAPVFVPSQPTKPQQAAVIVTEREPVHLEETSVEQVDQFEEKVEAELAPVAEPLQIEFHETQQPEVKPVTWAALASKNTPGGLVPVATTYSVQMVSHASKPPPSRSELPKTDAVSHQRGPRTPRERIIDRDRTSASRVDSDGDADSINGRSNSVGGGSRYSDTQQLYWQSSAKHHRTRVEGVL
uniref:NTF2 domain-containing protein n=1 Tax=Arion vulgaris TaxID=1028688 RepID=A0A0B7BIA6_9EUPU